MSPEDGLKFWGLTNLFQTVCPFETSALLALAPVTVSSYWALQKSFRIQHLFRMLQERLMWDCGKASPADSKDFPVKVDNLAAFCFVKSSLFASGKKIGCLLPNSPTKPRSPRRLMERQLSKSDPAGKSVGRSNQKRKTECCFGEWVGVRDAIFHGYCTIEGPRECFVDCLALQNASLKHQYTICC